MNKGSIVYVVLSGGGLESVWTTDDEAIDALEDIQGRSCHAYSAYITVRPIGHTKDTPESTEARNVLRNKEASRHNARAKAIREGIRKNR